MKVSHRNSGTHSWHVLQFNHFFSTSRVGPSSGTEERSKFGGSLGLQSYLWKGGIKGPLRPALFIDSQKGLGVALRAKNRHNEKHRVIRAVTFKRGPVSEWTPDLFTQRLETSNDEVKGHSLNRQGYIPNALCMVYLLTFTIQLPNVGEYTRHWASWVCFYRLLSFNQTWFKLHMENPNPGYWVNWYRFDVFLANTPLEWKCMNFLHSP